MNYMMLRRAGFTDPSLASFSRRFITPYEQSVTHNVVPLFTQDHFISAYTLWAACMVVEPFFGVLPMMKSCWVPYRLELAWKSHTNGYDQELRRVLNEFNSTEYRLSAKVKMAVVEASKFQKKNCKKLYSLCERAGGRLRVWKYVCRIQCCSPSSIYFQRWCIQWTTFQSVITRQKNLSLKQKHSINSIL